MFWGFLFGLLFFIPVFGMAIGAGLGALMGKLAKTSIDKQFQDQVDGMVQPGASALFLMLEKVTPDKAVEAMSKYGGTVLKTSLSKEDEKELQDALHGSQTAAQAAPPCGGVAVAEPSVRYSNRPAPDGYRAPNLANEYPCRPAIARRCAHQRAQPGADGHPEDRDEEQQAEQKPPEHAPGRPGADRVVAGADVIAAIVVPHDHRDRV